MCICVYIAKFFVNLRCWAVVVTVFILALGDLQMGKCCGRMGKHEPLSAATLYPPNISACTRASPLC